jgi:hypothetical protein
VYIGSENKGRLFEPKGDDATGGCRKVKLTIFVICAPKQMLLR